MDVNNKIHEWHTAKDLAALLGRHVSAISSAYRNGGLVAGHPVESRPTTRADRTTARKMYRVPPPGAPVESLRQDGGQSLQALYDDARADLAGCEARIEELEAELEFARGASKFVDAAHIDSLTDDLISAESRINDLEAIEDRHRACFEILEDQGIDLSDPDDLGLPGIVLDLVSGARFVHDYEHIATIEAENAKLTQKLADAIHKIERLKNQLSRESEITWGVRCDRDEHAKRADRLERELEEMRGQLISWPYKLRARAVSVRRVVRRVVEVVR